MEEKVSCLKEVDVLFLTIQDELGRGGRWFIAGSDEFNLINTQVHGNEDSCTLQIMEDHHSFIY